MQGNATGWTGGLRYQGELDQPFAHLRGLEAIEASGRLPEVGH